MLKAIIERILREYPAARAAEKVTNHPLARVIRHDLPKELKSLGVIPEGMKVQGSAGQGAWAIIPWAGIFDPEITKSAQDGYYVCYLFDATGRGVYVALALGWTQYEKAYHREARSLIRADAEGLDGYLPFSTELDDLDMDLSSTDKLARGYEAGYIRGKLYDADAIPEDDVLAADLATLLGFYRELKEQVGSQPLGKIRALLSGRASTMRPTRKQSLEEIRTKLLEFEGQGRASHKIVNGTKRVRVESRLQKHLIAQYEEWSCQACGWKSQKPDGSYIIEVDHIVEKSKKGTEEMSNLWVLCPNCHAEKTFGVLRLNKKRGVIIRNGQEQALHHDRHLLMPMSSKPTEQKL